MLKTEKEIMMFNLSEIVIDSSIIMQITHDLENNRSCGAKYVLK